MANLELGENREEKNEKWPTKQEIFDLLGLGNKECIVAQEKSDDQGLYDLIAEVENKENGERVEFRYVRKGKFEGHESADTKIIETIYDSTGDFVKFPEHIYTYFDTVGQWGKT